MAAGKKTGAGFAARLALVEAWLPGEYDRARKACAGLGVARDDILDAFAALWTAERVLRGEARRIPAVPERDPAGLPMQMVA